MTNGCFFGGSFNVWEKKLERSSSKRTSFHEGSINWQQTALLGLSQHMTIATTAAVKQTGTFSATQASPQRLEKEVTMSDHCWHFLFGGQFYGNQQNYGANRISVKRQAMSYQTPLSK